QLLGNTQNSRHRYAASTSGNPSFSVLRQLQYLCELTHARAPHQGRVEWKAINDYGGTEVFHGSVR
ncbi:hypothetical protein MTP31_24385, partial [Klebsiella pneumoniae]|nr:hypothetical protein [Klebsiella pneumoniae]MCJ0845471.1 hypothetical protein [Klebsiella pneumoniae]MCJ0856498.1 hypothetical protein [Klebsiella pneumoniae]MCJ0861816.1 hypothetical protein [Klebsiella pneumoniae]MCJ0866017.1 hypothetical protein [Klebsiella pneumoniae]